MAALMLSKTSYEEIQVIQEMYSFPLVKESTSILIQITLELASISEFSTMVHLEEEQKSLESLIQVMSVSQLLLLLLALIFPMVLQLQKVSPSDQMSHFIVGRLTDSTLPQETHLM